MFGLDQISIWSLAGVILITTCASASIFLLTSPFISRRGKVKPALAPSQISILHIFDTELDKLIQLCCKNGFRNLLLVTIAYSVISISIVLFTLTSRSLFVASDIQKISIIIFQDICVSFIILATSLFFTSKMQHLLRAKTTQRVPVKLIFFSLAYTSFVVFSLVIIRAACTTAICNCVVASESGLQFTFEPKLFATLLTNELTKASSLTTCMVLCFPLVISLFAFIAAITMYIYRTSLQLQYQLYHHSSVGQKLRDNSGHVYFLGSIGIALVF